MNPFVSALAAALLIPTAVAAQKAPGQPTDAKYTSDIKKFTTNACFSTPYVDHLAASENVPTPLDVLGHIAGAADVLTYSHDVHKYMRAVADATPRVKVFSAGKSEEGREMILVAVGSEEAIRNLGHYKQINARLADPRGLSDDEARELIHEAKPMYWATGAMHSPETGSPEMLMELVYRLAVEDTPFIQAIRDNVIFLTTPVLEVDGRDKRVDLLKLEQARPRRPVPRLLYWGKYVAHDNNRDAIAMGLALSKHLMSTFLEYHPQVLHDLHESASHLYTSTGTGPYNAWVDPILIDEWHVLAYQEITELTKLGVPGVWTHEFYDGWAPNYGFYAANGHNAIGRFYETQGAGSANTRRISTRGNRDWFRPNPPLRSTMWSIRNNVNLQQSGLLIAMHHVAKNHAKFMENFWLKSKRSCAKPFNEGPAAYVFPADDPRKGQQADLLNLLARQGCEVHRIARDSQLGKKTIPGGSFVVRMDQPYSRMADMLLDRCYYNVNDPRPYDDTGWTLGPLFNARVERIEDTKVLGLSMKQVKTPLFVPGGVEKLNGDKVVAWLVDDTADRSLATFRFAHRKMTMQAAESAFAVAGVQFNAGTFVIPRRGNNPDDVAAAAAEFGFTAYATGHMPDVRMHDVGVPRVAIMHTWTRTQNEGWVRMAFDASGVPYDYISVHDARDNPNLRDRYDVIVIGPTSSDALSVVRGLPMTGDPVAWKASELAPNIGRQDSTDDMRGGLELEGIVHLRDFVKQGGVLITLQGSCAIPTHFGLAQGVSIAETEDLQVSGSVLRATFADATSPIRYGYGESLGVSFRRSPVLRLGGGGGRFSRFRRPSSTHPDERLLSGDARPTGRGSIDDPDRVQGRPVDLGRPERSADNPAQSRRGRQGGGRGGFGQRRRGPRARTILRFEQDPKKLLISGLLAGGDELAGTPAVIDAPLGEGHVVLFACNPMWRHITQGSWMLVFNTILHHDSLGPRPTRRDTTEASAGNSREDR